MMATDDFLQAEFTHRAARDDHRQAAREFSQHLDALGNIALRRARGETIGVHLARADANDSDWELRRNKDNISASENNGLR